MMTRGHQVDRSDGQLIGCKKRNRRREASKVGRSDRR
jgi:hypothetical protein